MKSVNTYLTWSDHVNHSIEIQELMERLSGRSLQIQLYVWRDYFGGTDNSFRQTNNYSFAQDS